MVKDIFVGVSITIVAAWMLWLSSTMHTQAVAVATMATKVEYIKERVDRLDGQIMVPTSLARHEVAKVE